MATHESPPTDNTASLFTLSDPQGRSVEYYDKDNRHSQEYSGEIVVNYDLDLDTRALPPWEKTSSRISKYQYLLNRVGSMAQAMLRLNAAGLAHPSEVELNDRRNDLEVPEAAVDVDVSVFDLTDEDNPILGKAICPFEELKALLFRLGFGAKGYRDLDPSDDTAPFYVKAELRAEMERPSMIPTEEQLLAQLERIEAQFLPAAQASLARAADHMRARVHHYRDTNSATHYAEQWAKEFKSEARDRINYQERLEELRQELREETHTVAEETLQNWTDEELAEELGVPLNVIETVKRKWENFLSVRGGLMGPSTDNLDPAEVIPRGALEEDALEEAEA